MAISCVLTPTAFADRPPAAAPSNVNLAGQVELARLVDLCAERLKVNIEYDPAVVQGKLTVRLGAGLSDDELWQLMNRALAQKGLTTVRTDPGGIGGAAGAAGGRPAYAVVKIADAAGAARVRLPAGDGAGGPEAGSPVGQQTGQPGGPQAGFVTAVIKAEHRPARELADLVSKAMARGGGAGSGGGGGGGGSISPLGDQGLIVIADLAPRVEQAMELARMLDAAGSEAVIEQVDVRNLPPSQLATLVTQVLGKREAVGGGEKGGGGGGGGAGGQGEVMPAPDGRSLLVIAARSRVPVLRSVIEQLDKREPAETITYTPRHFPAKDVARLIEQTVRPGAGGGAGGAADDRWKVIEDELTGSLVVTATPGQHQKVRELVERLDSAPAAARRPVRSFVIRNRSVKEVKGIVEGLVQAGVLEADGEGTGAGAGTGPRAGGSAGASSPPAPPAAAMAAESAAAGTPGVTPLPPPPAMSSEPGRGLSRPALGAPGSAPPATTEVSPRGGGGGGGGGRSLVLSADEGTNTLIAVGEPRTLAQLEALLKTIDVRQPQVMLEVLLVTLSESQAIDLGVEIEKIAVHNDTRIRLSSLFGLGTRSGGGDRDGPLNASGLTGVVLNPGDFSVVLRALETLSNGRSVSMPRVLVGNNQQATLDSTLQQPYASQSLINAGTGGVNTSFGGTLDAGTTLSIKPQIAEGDHLILDYSVSLSSFTGAASASTLPPPRQQNKVQSQAAIPDGYTVVVGGIDVETSGKSTSQVPLIGSIPVLGEAFKNRSVSSSRSKFYVFIRANVLRSRGFEDLKYVSGQDAAAAKVDDGWPEVEPRVIR